MVQAGSRLGAFLGVATPFGKMASCALADTQIRSGASPYQGVSSLADERELIPTEKHFRRFLRLQLLIVLRVEQDELLVMERRVGPECQPAGILSLDLDQKLFVFRLEAI